MVEQGYFPLQWAALNNRVGIINYLLEAGAPVNLADHTGQNALHWAAVRGSLSAAETLLRSGSDLSLQDGKGCVFSLLPAVTSLLLSTLPHLHLMCLSVPEQLR